MHSIGMPAVGVEGEGPLFKRAASDMPGHGLSCDRPIQRYSTDHCRRDRQICVHELAGDIRLLVNHLPAPGYPRQVRGASIRSGPFTFRCQPAGMCHQQSGEHPHSQQCFIICRCVYKVVGDCHGCPVRAVTSHRTRAQPAYSTRYHLHLPYHMSRAPSSLFPPCPDFAPADSSHALLRPRSRRKYECMTLTRSFWYAEQSTQAQRRASPSSNGGCIVNYL